MDGCIKQRECCKCCFTCYYYGNSYIEEQRIDLGAFKAFGVWFPGSIESYEKRSSEFQKSAFFQAAPKWGELFSQLYSSELF